MTSPWPGSVPLTLDPLVNDLDLDASIGVRTATFKFNLIDGSSGENLGEVTPYVEGATLSHNSASTLKRRLTLQLGVDDTADINPLTDRIEPFMLIGGVSYPLGRFMFTDNLQQVSTGGNQANVSLVDEMFMIDQALDRSFSTKARETAESAVIRLLQDVAFPIFSSIAPSDFTCTEAAAVGTRRGGILEDIARQGDYQSPWMDNSGKFRMIRTVDASVATPRFDYDTRHAIYQESVTRTTDILNAPNRFIVISTGSAAADNPVVGVYDTPASAPHSIQSRGFVIPLVSNVQVSSSTQAAATARAIGITATITEQATFSTPPDPRHDSYDVCIFEGERWMEISWTMSLVEGGAMNHVLARRYLA